MKITGNYQPYPFQVNNKQSKSTLTTFAQTIAQAVKQNNSTPSVSTELRGQMYHVFLPNEKTLYSGGNGAGVSFKLEYAENSTGSNPIIFAKGIDENGKEFEKNININDIDPSNATLVEMRALEAYLNVPKGNGLSSLPMGTGYLKLNDRTNFINMFNKEITDNTKLGQYQRAQFYANSMKHYTEFVRKTQNIVNS